MCADIDKAENQTAGCDDHCSTGAVQASRLGWGSWSSWWRSVRRRAAEAAKKAAEAKKKAKCMETCKSLDCGLPPCKKVPEYRKCPPKYSSKDIRISHLSEYTCKTGFDMYRWGSEYKDEPRRRAWPPLPRDGSMAHFGITGIDESRKHFKCLGKSGCRENLDYYGGQEVRYYFTNRRNVKCTDKCTCEVFLERKKRNVPTWRFVGYTPLGAGSDYLSER